ncbi:MAG: acylphosphatase [Candidatus Altiarchaeota archaeon]|nr:acylphosphatase [Candidatus Altiarchaeota archaeon]
MASIQAHVYVSGRVQGVFFRASTRDEARRLGLTGWVSNLPDGRVEAVFEGEEDLVKEMVGWCHHGPSYASVSDVKTEFNKASEKFRDFEIRCSHQRW